MIRWRFFEPSPIRDLLDQMMQESRRWRELGRGEWMPMNVHETESETVVQAALPGVKPEDVEITGSEGLLTIRARAQVEDRDYHHQEIHNVDYERQLAVPPDVRLDQARAEFANGILTVHLPKVQPKTPERVRIEIAGGGEPAAIEAAHGEGYSEVKMGAPRQATRKTGTSRTGRASKTQKPGRV